MTQRLRSSRFLAFATVLLVAIGLALAGCSSDRTAPNAPQGASLSIRNPVDLSRVMRTQDLHTAALLRIPGVVGTGTGASADGEAEILVLTDREGVAGVPEEIDGVRVERRFVGKVVAYAKPSPNTTLQMGTSTGNDRECAAGTLGCVVTRSGTRYFLSNNHVFARENAAANNERIDAPGRYDGKPRCVQTAQCGTLADFEPIRFGQTNTIDAALALPIASRAYTCAEKGGYTPTSNVVQPSVGLPVKKTGRTTGLTTGTIQAVNVTINVGYSSGTATFTGQIMTPGNFINSGDSGSLMVTQAGNDAVGLCFAGGAGGSFANPIGAVLSRFGNATICGQ